MSSPSIASRSKAIRRTSWSCLLERRASKSAKPLARKITASPSITRCRTQLAGGLLDQGISFGPIVAVPREQPYAVALALNYQPETVVLDLVHPVRTGRNVAPARWDAGLKR